MMVLISFLKRSRILLGLVTGTAFTLVAIPVKAYTFTRSHVTPNDVLNVTSLGYTYDTLPNGNVSVRKNAASLSSQEISDFVNAVVTLKQTWTTSPNGQQIRLYDRFVAVHIGAQNAIGRLAPDGSTMVDPAHGSEAFLPWHRQYLNEFEKALQTVNPNVTIPYWDFTNQTATQNIVFQDNFIGPNGGVNGVGGGAVLSGFFTAANNWTVRRDLTGAWTGVNPNPQVPINRRLQAYNNLPPASRVPAALSQSTYGAFRTYVQRNLHNSVHGWVGGTMGNVTSAPNDPIFWMLHANVDRYWAEWQANGRSGSAWYPTSGLPYGHNLNDLMWPWNGDVFNVAASLEDLLPSLPGSNLRSMAPAPFVASALTSEMSIAANDEYIVGGKDMDHDHGLGEPDDGEPHVGGMMCPFLANQLCSCNGTTCPYHNDSAPSTDHNHGPVATAEVPEASTIGASLISAVVLTGGLVLKRRLKRAQAGLDGSGLDA